MSRLKAALNTALNKRYKYNPEKYGEGFWDITPVNEVVASEAATKVYCFWTGNNAMSKDRALCFDALQKNIGVEVVLVTPKNLGDYILPKFPLHSAYDNLSLVHKADYLRCYFMHHHGGGYADIKSFNKSWVDAFSSLNENQNKWMLGYREVGVRGVAPVDGVIGEDMRRYWHILIGNCAYISKPNTPFTQAWYCEVNRRLDGYSNALIQNKGNTMGDNPGYPIPWTAILGNIFHPLCLRFHNRLMYSSKLMFSPNKYR